MVDLHTLDAGGRGVEVIAGLVPDRRAVVVVESRAHLLFSGKDRAQMVQRSMRQGSDRASGDRSGTAGRASLSLSPVLSLSSDARISERRNREGGGQGSGRGDVTNVRRATSPLTEEGMDVEICLCEQLQVGQLCG